MAHGFVPLRVAAVDRLTRDSAAVTFDVPPALAEQFRFSPGQHLTLRRVVDGQDVRRTYSLCSSAAGGPLRVAVKRLEGGAFSSWVIDGLRAGDELEVLPPAGRFGPQVDPSRALRYGLVAAGSGITPVLSIAWTVLDVEPDSEVVLLYGNRTSGDVMLLEELSDLKDRYPSRLQVLHVLSREEQASELLSGRLDGERLGRLAEAVGPVDEWYLAGRSGWSSTAGRRCSTAASPPTACTSSCSSPSPRRPASAAPSSPTARRSRPRLHGRATTLHVGPDERVLDAVLAVRDDAPYACKGGVCGTCRARCTSGSVEMDVNYALEPDELAAGVVLTCQARPTSDVVRLEFL